MSNKNTVTYDRCIFEGETSISIYQRSKGSYGKPKRIDGLLYDIPETLPQKLIGRSIEMREIYNLLLNDKHRRVAITGLGGIGKTYLALNCALTWFNSGNKMFNSIILIRAQSKTSFENSLKGLAEKLNISSDQLILEMVKDIFKCYKGKKILLILDNINSCEFLDDLINTQEGYKNVYVLATSQNSELRNICNCYYLTTLNEDDSFDLIYEIVGSDFNKNELIKLGDLCEGLPLALTQAACYIKDNNSIDEYFNHFNELLDEPFPDNINTKNRKTAFVTIKINVNRIQGEHTRRLLALLTFLNYAEIDVDIFQYLFDDNVLKKAVNELKKYCLIALDGNKIQILHLIQDICRTILQPDEKDLMYMILIVSSDSRNYLNHMDFLSDNITDFNKILTDSKLEHMSLICKKLFESKEKKICDILKVAGCKVVDVSDWPDFVVGSGIGFYNKMVASVVLNKLYDLNGQNVSVCGRDGITALHVASAVGGRFVLQHLLEMGAVTNVKTSDGITPMHIASVANKEYNIAALIKSGADVNVTDSSGNTPLHLSAKCMNWCVTAILLNNGAHPNLQNTHGDTALHMCASVPYEHLRTEFTLSLLLGASADVALVNKQGEDALQLALNVDNNETAKCIRNPDKLKGIKKWNICSIM